MCVGGGGGAGGRGKQRKRERESELRRSVRIGDADDAMPISGARNNAVQGQLTSKYANWEGLQVSEGGLAVSADPPSMPGHPRRHSSCTATGRTSTASPDLRWGVNLPSSHLAFFHTSRRATTWVKGAPGTPTHQHTNRQVEKRGQEDWQARVRGATSLAPSPPTCMPGNTATVFVSMM